MNKLTHRSGQNSQTQTVEFRPGSRESHRASQTLSFCGSQSVDLKQRTYTTNKWRVADQGVSSRTFLSIS